MQYSYCTHICLSAGHCRGLESASDVRWHRAQCRGRGEHLLPGVRGRPLQPELRGLGPAARHGWLLLLLPLPLLLQLHLDTVALLLQLLGVQWHERGGPWSELHNQHQHHWHRESGLLINQLVMSDQWRAIDWKYFLRQWEKLKGFSFQIFDLPESMYSIAQTSASREQELSHLENSFTALNTLEHEEAGHEAYEEESEEKEEDVRNSFDIETLVDECFMNETGSRGVIVQSWGKLWRKIQTETSSVADYTRHQFNAKNTQKNCANFTHLWH